MATKNSPGRRGTLVVVVALIVLLAIFTPVYLVLAAHGTHGETLSTTRDTGETTLPPSPETSQPSTSGFRPTKVTTGPTVPALAGSSSSTLASPSTLTTSIENSTKIAPDLGPADRLNLGGAWLQIARACSFEADSARAWDVELDYSPSGYLVHLFLIAVTAGDREVRVSWDGYGGQPGQDVRATIATAPTSGGPKSISDYSMNAVLRAIDAVGAKNMTAKLPGASAGGNYELGLMFLDAWKGALPPEGSAYSWDGSAFQPLTGAARSVPLDSSHLALSGTARVPVPSTTTTFSASTSSTYGVSTATTSPYESIGIGYFVIPVASTQPGTTESSETTTTSQLTQSDVRIGVMIPAYMLYQGHLFACSGLTVAASKRTPPDLSLLGSGRAALDQNGALDPGSTAYEIYAIEGIDQEKAIAVKFQGVSNGGPVWVWLEYERKR